MKPHTAYDADGNVTKVVDPAGNATRYTYDANNELLTETNSLNATEHYSYDAAGNLIVRRPIVTAV